MKRLIGLALFGLGLCASCGPTDSKPNGNESPTPPSAREWACTTKSGGSGCSCNAYAGKGVAFAASFIDVCDLWNCCLLTEGLSTSDGPVASCECFDSSGACAAEQMARPGTKMVTQCPPPQEAVPSACAAEGISCSDDYLASQNFHDCCAGLTCAANAQGVKVCRALSAEEAPLASECKRATIGDEEFRMVEPVATSAGNFSFDTVSSIFASTGAGGCLTGVNVFLTGPPGGLSLCYFSIDAGPATDASGNFVITRTVLALEDCPTLPPGIANDSNLSDAAGTIAFNGLSCENRATAFGEPEACYAGTFEIRLTGRVTALGGAGAASLMGTPFHVSARLCGLPSALGRTTCPAHP